MKYRANGMETAGRKWVSMEIELPNVIHKQVVADAERRGISLRQWFAQVANNFFVDQATEARLASARGQHIPKLPVVVEG